MDESVRSLFSGEEFYLSRNPSILWRKNQDGTVLALDEVTGTAWALSKGLSDIWLKIGTGIHITELPSLHNENDPIPKVLHKGIEALMAHNLVTIPDKDVKEAPSAKYSTFSYSVLGQIEGPFSCNAIEFGACNCQNGYAFLRQIFTCNNWTQAQATSVIR
jgi:hypothetical protein